MNFVSDRRINGIKKIAPYLVGGLVTLAITSVDNPGSSGPQIPVESKQSPAQYEKTPNFEVEGAGFRAQIFLEDPTSVRAYESDELRERLRMGMLEFMGYLHSPPDLRKRLDAIDFDALLKKREALLDCKQRDEENETNNLRQKV